MFAEDVDYAGHSSRVLVNAFDSFRRKDRLAFGPCNTEPLLDVTECFRQRELARSVTQRNPLPKLPQLWVLKLPFEFRLAGQDDLKQFLARGLQICQQPDFFEQFQAEILRLIHNEHRRLGLSSDVS